MKVAIVGAGLAGLGVSSFLLDRNVEVTLFDPKGPGGGASGVSTGLLHPFPARTALRSWMASEGMSASWNLIEKVEQSLGSPVAERSGILRLASNERQISDFKKRAQEDPEAIWWEKEQVIEKVPNAAPFPGLWIPSGGTIYSKLYLQGLYKLALQKGLQFQKASIRSTDELASFDQIVLATGYEVARFPECASLLLEPTKGHTIVCKWPYEKLPCSIISSGHISPTEDPALCQIGSTYEHNFQNLDPDPKAVEVLKEKAALFFPPAASLEVVELRVGVRTSIPKGYRPIVEKVSPKVWVFTGLGSRGLLYHALLGEQLAASIEREG